MKYLLILSFAFFATSTIRAQTGNDTTAIKQVLEKESATWRNGDVKAYTTCWHVQPYSKILVSTTEGKTFVVPPSAITNPPAGSMGNGGSSINTNYQFSIHGNDAWVSHDEVSTAANGVKSYSHEIRILEKINGEWKLVAQSIHLYKPE